MADEVIPVVPVAPAAPVLEIPEREKLAQAITSEKRLRSQKVMQMIEQICKESNCMFIATPTLVELPGGGFVISAKPGVMPL